MPLYKAALIQAASAMLILSLLATIATAEDAILKAPPPTAIDANVVLYVDEDANVGEDAGEDTHVDEDANVSEYAGEDADAADKFADDAEDASGEDAGDVETIGDVDETINMVSRLEIKRVKKIPGCAWKRDCPPFVLDLRPLPYQAVVGKMGQARCPESFRTLKASGLRACHIIRRKLKLNWAGERSQGLCHWDATALYRTGGIAMKRFGGDSSKMICIRRTPKPTTTTTTTTTTSHFNRCDEQTQFDIMMCKAYMCTKCSAEFCIKSCQELQASYPTCVCEQWPRSREGYKSTYSSANFAGKGKFGDAGDYAKSAFVFQEED